MDIKDPDILLKKIEKLESSKIWQSSLEMKAFLFLKVNQKEEAKKYLIQF